MVAYERSCTTRHTTVQRLIDTSKQKTCSHYYKGFVIVSFRKYFHLNFILCFKTKMDTNSLFAYCLESMESC